MAEFTDASLTPRARLMALWLADLTNLVLSRADREASADLLLRQLPDSWTAAMAEESSREVRAQVGPRASHRAWLSAMGWMVGEEERLPPRAEAGPSLAARETARRRLRDVLAVLEGAHA